MARILPHTMQTTVYPYGKRFPWYPLGIVTFNIEPDPEPGYHVVNFWVEVEYVEIERIGVRRWFRLLHHS